MGISGEPSLPGWRLAKKVQYLLPDLSRSDCVKLVARGVDYFCVGVISVKMMNPDSLLAQGDVAYDVGLDGAAVVIINRTDFLVLCMMRVTTEDEIGALFFAYFAAPSATVLIART